ncbi:hypothetical protein [Mycoplana dimorpha]|uniref:Outer membrane lipoprotein omp10 n=1 Tax=Mycoplana dimorpha TaxID=28320 RepID=A0A2T5B5Z3_MYCDI|nr:hypothetical protein [Mycoplana dimorpha]PTM94353.1 hypothetical protein C7449_105254 [Mycoplana dimorpha]
MKPLIFAALLAGAATLASCNSYDRAPVRPVAQAPQGVEGSWVDANGLVSTFSAGQFATRTTDTNTTMATGTYITQPGGLIEISLYSNISKSASKANCSLVTPRQLNCTSGSGAQFTLNRQG